MRDPGNEVADINEILLLTSRVKNKATSFPGSLILPPQGAVRFFFII